MTHGKNIRTNEPTSTSAPLSTGLLQRKCACGQHTIAGEECEECQTQRLNQQFNANQQLHNLTQIQTKLIINEPGDEYEQEADRVAEQVMATSTHSVTNNVAPRILRYTKQSSQAANTAPASVERVLASLGNPLEPSLRQDMEARFGYDFSKVRVHTGSEAEQSAREVNAHAYTVGQNVVFGTGQYQPAANEGRKLVAHELAHVVQQSDSNNIGIQCQEKIATDSEANEAAKTPATDKFAEERAKLNAIGLKTLKELSETSSADLNRTPGNVGQGNIEEGKEIPPWFWTIQNLLVSRTAWGEKEEAAQRAIRDYAMLFAKEHAGPDGKVPGHIKVFLEYIGRGSKNDAAARRAGYKGSSDLGGAAGTRNWCAAAATAASRIAREEERSDVIAYLKSKDLEITVPAYNFFANLARLSGSTESKQFWGSHAYALPLEPGDRVDYLFDQCQYGGHAVHVVADLGDTFLHVSGNTTNYSAVAIGAAKRCKTSPAGLDLTKATTTDTEDHRLAATRHISTLNFVGGVLTYSITRSSDPYKALSMLETDDATVFEESLKKLSLKRVR